TLAEFLFSDEDAMIKLDMSEYMEKHSVSRLVGSPPRPNGYDERGALPAREQARPVDFRNTIVIMTSNIGAGTISKNQTLGFSIGDDTGLSYDEMKSRIMGELKKVFRPELLNRIDDVIVFHKLTKEEILTIVELMMKRLRDQMGEDDAVIPLAAGA